MAGLIRPFNGIAPRIADSAFVAETAVIIGDVEIGPDANIWYGVVIRGDVNRIRIGPRTNVQDGTVIHVDAEGEHWNGVPTLIGGDVTIGHRAMLHACTLEDGAFVGMSATVLDGAVVESGAMVAAGALVTPGKRIPKGQLWAGTPARYMRDLSADELAYFRVSAEHYVGLSRKYL
ncbi:MAG TPA: gamma carbonic anhydrase family protein [Alphaproteobacteria bacterium]|jgi:carbonic anhydrase/acetyltransferase-like protein (isoleucine patch superfamily)